MKKFLKVFAVVLVFCIGMFAVQAEAAVISEIEPNNMLSTAQNIDLYFTVGFDEEIFFSSTIPWVSIEGTGDDTFDYYSFAATAYSTAIFDIDHTNFDFDTVIALWSSDGTLLTYSDDCCWMDPGSDKIFDSLLLYTFASTGTYIIGVAEYWPEPGPSGFTDLDNGPIDLGHNYILNFTVENHTVVVPVPSAILLLGSGLVGLVGVRKRFKTKPNTS